MDDVRAVMDAVGSERAALFGYSEGGPMSVLFAATYPARTRALVLYGTYAKRLRTDDDYPWAPTWDERVAAAEELERALGRASSTSRRWRRMPRPTSPSGPAAEDVPRSARAAHTT